MNRELNIKILNPLLEAVDMPATVESAAFDLRACIDKPITIYPESDPVIIPFGIAIEGKDTDKFPCVYLIFTRSGLGVKHGITLSNSVGVIDTDYRGEIMGGFINNSTRPYVINPLDRVAQLVIFPIDKPVINIVHEISATSRGIGGFGSTGKD